MAHPELELVKGKRLRVNGLQNFCFMLQIFRLEPYESWQYSENGDKYGTGRKQS